MLKNLKKYGILFCIATASFIACRPKTYDYNSTVAPSGINYSVYNYGSGTSATTGAFIVNIRSASTNNYNEYYTVQIFGIGTYTIQPGYNQLFVPNAWANSYNFSVEKVCAAGNANGCFPKTLTGVATINTESTTVADVWF